jgi:hypothetical protein
MYLWILFYSDHMHFLFGEIWNVNKAPLHLDAIIISKSHPDWMKSLVFRLGDKHSSVNCKLFLAKIVINRSSKLTLFH